MCTKPIKIRNNTKYFTANNAQPYYIWVNCGHCEECIRQKQTEWNLRTYYEMLETINNGGWIYFDTLTYNRESLPRLKGYIATDKNYPCFDYKHIRQFYEALKQKLGDKAFRYFITSEYGDIRKRPHYHILLFFQNKEINPIEVSQNVSKFWKKGRTDGIPYKSKKYVETHNIITKINLNAIRYVAKYVTKSVSYMEEINKRWNALERYYKNQKQYDKIKIKQIKRNYYQHATPFHRQSQYYGYSALKYLDYNEIVNSGRMFYNDDTLKIIKYCAIPDYFKRHLWQKQIKYNGKRIWINTEEGIKVKKQTEDRIKQKLIDRLKDLNRTKGMQYENEIEDLAEYILFKRGRFKGILDYKPHHEEAIYYGYHTDRDLKYLGRKGISKEFIGNDIIGYCTTEFEETEIENEVYTNSHLEAIINDLMVERDTTSLSILKEHMREIRKIFFPNLLQN